MSLGRGNELVQELYERLTGLWYKKGIYKNERLTATEVKKLITEIKKEYDEDDEQIRKSQSQNE